MEQLNLLVNAGHSPQSLARQLVRYLRNALMAKLGGEQTELLEISADERARAARTAMLFGEEDLTRNLQIVLRAFDDLNYRQEQRFHLELALLKLIHAQRLLPIEELLSGVAAGSGSRTAAPVAPRASSAAPAAPRAQSAFRAAEPTPFVAAPVRVETRLDATPAQTTVTAPAQVNTRVPEVAVESPSASASAAAVPSEAPEVLAQATTEVSKPEPQTRTAEPVTNAPTPEGIEGLRQAVCAALDQAGHASAAQLVERASGRWTGRSCASRPRPWARRC